MPYAPQRRRHLQTRALSPGEVRVRIVKGDTLLHTKIGWISGSAVTVEYLGERHHAERDGQHWRLNVEKLRDSA